MVSRTGYSGELGYEVFAHPDDCEAVWDAIAGLMPVLTLDRQAEVYRMMSESAQPSIDFFVLITLASAIAGLGLLQNSAAVIIGAMLVVVRIYDWDRTDAEGKSRELHIAEALDAIDFNVYKNYKTEYHASENETVPVIDEKYFTTNIMHFHKPVSKDYEELDSFVIYIVTEGSVKLKYDDGETDLGKGDVVLIPNLIEKIDIYPTPRVNMLEVFVR
jgi:mannose-6-phosphate isomerase-like protein (cupin superfamily)